MKDNTLHSTQPLAAPRNIEICRDMLMQIPKSTCSFNTFPVQPADNSRSSDGVMHNKGYSLRPPHHMPSNQFSFVRGEHHVKSQREVPPPPSYSNAGHFTKNMKRENNCNNHERLKPPPCDYQESWNFPAPYSGNIVLTGDISDCLLWLCINVLMFIFLGFPHAGPWYHDKRCAGPLWLSSK